MVTRVSEDMAREAAEEEERRKEVRLAGTNDKDVEKDKRRKRRDVGLAGTNDKDVEKDKEKGRECEQWMMFL